jgi:hypothetical protein
VRIKGKEIRVRSQQSTAFNCDRGVDKGVEAFED